MECVYIYPSIMYLSQLVVYVSMAMTLHTHHTVGDVRSMLPYHVIWYMEWEKMLTTK